MENRFCLVPCVLSAEFLKHASLPVTRGLTMEGYLLLVSFVQEEGFSETVRRCVGNNGPMGFSTYSFFATRNYREKGAMRTVVIGSNVLRRREPSFLRSHSLSVTASSVMMTKRQTNRKERWRGERCGIASVEPPKAHERRRRRRKRAAFVPRKFAPRWGT